MAAPASRLGPAFAARRGSTGLIPFLTAGYPSLDATLEMALDFSRAGALALEIGIPFSDPIADGPDIQRASEWALRLGVTRERVLDLVRALRRASEIPVVLMSYANPVLIGGAESFLSAAREAGVDGIILSDVPPDQAPELWSACDRAGLDTVVLVAPTTEAARIPMLLSRARGFVYCLARTGVTGSGPGESGDVAARVRALRAHTPLPVAVGFGISTAEQAGALRGVADGAIVGAAFMRQIAADPARGARERVAELGGRLLAALGPAPAA
jgi:tryptophan synthase alpha chain